MDEYDKILKLAADDRLELAESFKDVLHTELVLGQTRYVCRYGTLSEGHDHITDAQRYYQAIKEMYTLSHSVRDAQYSAMVAQADLMDAEAGLKKAKKKSDKLRCEARILQCKTRLVDQLVSIEDRMRMIDEYNRVRMELKEHVQRRYPLGIEQAESDHWKSVAVHRHLSGMLTEQVKPMANVPLSNEDKLQLGHQIGRPDMAVPYLVNQGVVPIQLDHVLAKIENVNNYITQVKQKELEDANKTREKARLTGDQSTV